MTPHGPASAVDGRDAALALYGALLVIAVTWFLGAGVVIHNWALAIGGAAASAPAVVIGMRTTGFPRARALSAGLLLTAAVAVGTAQITVDLHAWSPSSPVSEYACGSTFPYAATLLAGQEFVISDSAFVVYPPGEVAHLRSVCGQRLAASERLTVLLLGLALACFAAGLPPYVWRHRPRTPHVRRKRPPARTAAPTPATPQSGRSLR